MAAHWNQKNIYFCKGPHGALYMSQNNFKLELVVQNKQRDKLKRIFLMALKLFLLSCFSNKKEFMGLKCRYLILFILSLKADDPSYLSSIEHHLVKDNSSVT